MSEEAELAELEQSVTTLVDLMHSLLAAVETYEQAGSADPGDATLAEARAAMDDIATQLDECEAARDAWPAQLAEVTESIGTQRAGLLTEFATLKENAAAVTTSGTQAIAALRETTTSRIESTLEMMQRELGATAESLDRALETAGSGLSELKSHAAEHRLEGVAGTGLESIERVTDTLGALEESGVGIAGDVVDSVDDITGKLDDIVNVIGTIKPVLDAVAVIA
jgi:chromosome segregation ATPase